MLLQQFGEREIGRFQNQRMFDAIEASSMVEGVCM